VLCPDSLVPSPTAPRWYALELDVVFKDDVVRGTRRAVVNTATQYLAHLTSLVGENPFDTSMFFHIGEDVKKLCVRMLLFEKRKAAQHVVIQLENGTTLNLSRMSVANVNISQLTTSPQAQLLTVQLYQHHCPSSPPQTAPHTPSSVVSFVVVPKLASGLTSRYLEDISCWPRQLTWEKCHLRPSRQRQDFFCGDPDNIILMSPVLHKAFDGCSGLASVIIEPIDVVPPSGGEPHGVVVMRLYLQDSNLLNVVHFRPEVTFEDGSTDGGQVLTLALSDPSPARFAAFLLYKSEYERSRAHASTVASAWSPPTSVPASTEGLRKLLTPAGFQVYLQLQGRRTDTKGLYEQCHLVVRCIVPSQG
jgi:hypothetical protein